MRPSTHRYSCVRVFAAVLVGVLMGWSFAARAVETVTYYHLDALGSPVAATDASGNVVWREAYRPYGARINMEPAAANQSRWYTGHPHDEDSGLTYAGARYYDPVVGRFMGVDPVGVGEGNVHSFNRYAYGNNNPYAYVDPDGRVAETAWDAINIGLGAASFVQNIGAGNYWSAALDAVGVVVDSAAAAIPFVPGGAGTLIKTSRVVDNVTDVPKNVGRSGRQARLRELANDPKISSADRGWIRQEMNQIERGKRRSIRLPGSSRKRTNEGREYGGPGGKELAHRRGFEAQKGHSYKHSDLQDKDLHKLQHKFEGY